MSIQWVSRIIYILLIGLITFFVASFSEAAKVVDFLDNLEENISTNERALIAASMIANNHDGTDVYVKNTPIYEESFLSTQYKVDVSIYPLVEFKDEKAHNSIAILLTNLEINDELAALNDDDYHIIGANISFDRNLEVGNSDSFNESMTTLYDDTLRLIVINQEKLNTTTGPAVFKQITFTYASDSGSEVILAILSNSDLMTISYNDAFDESFDRDIKQLTPDALDLFSVYGINQLDNVNIYYDETLVDTLSSYNWYYVKNIGIEIAIVLPITYLLFFHKYVFEIMRNKKRIKNEKEILERNKIRQDIINKENNNLPD